MNIDRLQERVEQAIVQEIQFTNGIAQIEPENYIPQFVQNLKKTLTEIILDEIAFNRKY